MYTRATAVKASQLSRPKRFSLISASIAKKETAAAKTVVRVSESLGKHLVGSLLAC